MSLRAVSDHIDTAAPHPGAFPVFRLTVTPDWATVGENHTHVEAASSCRLSSPVSIYVVAQDAGLTFKLSISMFDQEGVRGLTLKLSPRARLSLADLLAKRTDEIRDACNAQLDSEDCIRGMLEFAEAA